MSKIFLEKAIFVNRAPFDDSEVDFTENEVAVLTAVNGKGKTTILSHIVDAFYEMARSNFQDFEEKRNKYYRVSSAIYNLDQQQPSFVYLRFKSGEENIDYVDIRNNCTEEQYNNAIKIENKIPFGEIKPGLDENNNIKKVSSNFDKKKADAIFYNNLLTYFPSYRFEIPGYINDPYKIKLDFKKQSEFSGYLKNRIEVVSGLPSLANWIMDIVLDLRINQQSQSSILYNNLNAIITQTLMSKNFGNVRFGVGPRGLGGTRIQILENKDGGEMKYPTIFNLSSGESSMLCLFGELLRQGDNYRNDIPMEEIAGIVLIDEVDKHLHIKLQKEILPKLFKLFPNVQFIISSHSPFLSMGLAEEMQERSKIIDLDNFGISKDPSTNQLYTEVYNMMISENENYKKMYEAIQGQVDNTKSLQIITEGNNNEHIEKALTILSKDLLDKIKIIKGAEDETSDEKLKNAFNIFSKGEHSGKFLFVWDCDYKSKFDLLNENETFYKYCFEKNESNTKTDRGIENLYSDDFFTEDVYRNEKKSISYGGEQASKVFDKQKFLEKIKQQGDISVFANYNSLIEKIKSIINPVETLSENNK